MSKLLSPLLKYSILNEMFQLFLFPHKFLIFLNGSFQNPFVSQGRINEQYCLTGSAIDFPASPSCRSYVVTQRASRKASCPYVLASYLPTQPPLPGRPRQPPQAPRVCEPLSKCCHHSPFKARFLGSVSAELQVTRVDEAAEIYKSSAEVPGLAGR